MQPVDTLLALTPGPDNLFVLAQAAQRGKMAGIAVTVGLCTGLLVHTSAVALGVAAIFQASAVAFSLLKFIGAAYLLYLAYLSFVAGTECSVEQQTQNLTFGRLYSRGIIMNITNPKVSLFFLAFLPQFTDPAFGPLVPQVLLLGLLFILSTILIFGGISALLLKTCHSFQYPLEGCKKQEIWESILKLGTLSDHQGTYTPQGGTELSPGFFPVYRG